MGFKQWRNYTATVTINSNHIETLPITASRNFAAFLSDTHASYGQQGDLSGGSAIIEITNNTVTWIYNWNTSTDMMVNIFVIGII